MGSTSEPNSPPSKLDRAKAGGWLFCAALSDLTVAATLLGFLAAWLWLGELACHFRAQYAVVLLAAASCFAAGRRFRRCGLAATAGCLNLALILPLYFGAPATGDANQPHRLLLLNVNANNGHFDQVRQYIQESNPDIIVLVEVNNRWVQQLEPLTAAYPHAVWLPLENKFGLIVYSRYELSGSEVRHTEDFPNGFTVARIPVAGKRLTVAGVHPPPPVSPAATAIRNEQLQDLAAWANEQSGPLLLAGDLNTTSWSPAFARLLEEGQLRDARQGFGVCPTWPARIPLMWIPIDHCLVSPGVVIHDHQVGPYLGSDHCPVIIDFSLAD